MGKRAIENLHFIEDSSDEIFLSEIYLKNDRVRITINHHLGLREFQLFLLEHPGENPDLLLVDLNLPGTKGTQLIDRLLKDKRTPHMVAGICTGSEDPQDELEAAVSGAHFFVNKPLNLECLKKICRSVNSLTLDTDADGTSTLFRK